MADSIDLKVEPVTVQAQTFRKLREAILNGVFKPGERLTEAKLCARMGVSRTSIREGLRRLEGERLITILPTKSPTVTQITWTAAEETYPVRKRQSAVYDKRVSGLVALGGRHRTKK